MSVGGGASSEVSGCITQCIDVPGMFALEIPTTCPSGTNVHEPEVHSITTVCPDV